MDATVVEQVANAIWPLIATGAAQRVGEMGTEQAVGKTASVLDKLGRSRRDRGLDEMPATADELRADLAALADADPEVAEVINVVNNHFYGEVRGDYQNFGFAGRHD